MGAKAAENFYAHLEMSIDSFHWGVDDFQEPENKG